MKTILNYILFSLTVVSVQVVAADRMKHGDRTKGAKVWADNCGRCHNIRDARELRDDQWMTTVFHMRIRAGLTGQETRDVLSFLIGTNNAARDNVIKAASSPVGGTAISGKKVFQQTCIACHGANGKGTLPGAPDFTSAKGPLRKSDSILIKNITEGFQSPGSPMAMPAKGGKADLTPNDIRAVLAYIRNQFGKKK